MEREREQWVREHLQERGFAPDPDRLGWVRGSAFVSETMIRDHEHRVWDWSKDRAPVPATISDDDFIRLFCGYA